MISLAFFLAFWGTVYNSLINHSIIQGNKIVQLPSF